MRLSPHHGTAGVLPRHRLEGEPRGLENQRLEWVDPARAAEVGDLLPATLPPLRWLQLPTRYGISSIGSRAACRLSWAGWTRRWRVA